MFQDFNNEFELESHADAFGVANQDLVHRTRAVLSEDLAAEQTYRQLARDLNDPAADLVLGLLVRETQERCVLLQRIVDGALGDLATSAPAAASLATDAARVQAVCLDIQELVRGCRRHADQLRGLACAERGRGHAPLGAILDTLARDSDKHGSLLLELGCYLRTPRWPQREVARV
jgi:hypothetical protein